MLLIGQKEPLPQGHTVLTSPFQSGSTTSNFHNLLFVVLKAAVEAAISRPKEFCVAAVTSCLHAWSAQRRHSVAARQQTSPA